MKSVIVLGGYGAFGARLSKRLGADGWLVLVAGRDNAKAAALASQLPEARALVADRSGDLTSILVAHRPFLLIDAAGPFQDSGYQVAEACLANGVHYIDLADARGFVARITGLDAAARSVGMTVLTGASSVPSLSSAVVEHLAADMDDVRAVNLSISASNRAKAGASIAAGILSYVGRPVRLWRGRQWVQEIGWRMLLRDISGRRSNPDPPACRPIRRSRSRHSPGNDPGPAGDSLSRGSGVRITVAANLAAWLAGPVAMVAITEELFEMALPAAKADGRLWDQPLGNDD